jgi:hypothetical protein
VATVELIFNPQLRSEPNGTCGKSNPSDSTLQSLSLVNRHPVSGWPSNLAIGRHANSPPPSRAGPIHCQSPTLPIHHLSTKSLSLWHIMRQPCGSRAMHRALQAAGGGTIFSPRLTNRAARGRQLGSRHSLSGHRVPDTCVMPVQGCKRYGYYPTIRLAVLNAVCRRWTLTGGEAS